MGTHGEFRQFADDASVEEEAHLDRGGEAAVGGEVPPELIRARIAGCP